MDFEGDSGLYSMSVQYGTNHHRHTVEDHDYDDLNNHKATMTNDAINDGTLPSQSQSGTTPRQQKFSKPVSP